MAVPGAKHKEAVGAKPVQAVSTHFIYKEARMMMALAGEDGEVAWFGGTVCHYDSNAKSWLIAYCPAPYTADTRRHSQTLAHFLRGLYGGHLRSPYSKCEAGGAHGYLF